MAQQLKRGDDSQFRVESWRKERSKRTPIKADPICHLDQIAQQTEDIEDASRVN